MNDITCLLTAIERGDRRATEELLPLVYDELRKLAAYRLAQEKPGQTLQATALVHEAYLRLVGPEDAPDWNGRGHFFAAAAEAMRRILVEAARRKAGPKAGGGMERVEFDAIEPATGDSDDDRLDLIALDEALTALEAHDRRKADVVRLRFFAGLTVQEAAEALGISAATAANDWSYARSWLRVAMLGNESDGENPAAR